MLVTFAFHLAIPVYDLFVSRNECIWWEVIAPSIMHLLRQIWCQQSNVLDD